MNKLDKSTCRIIGEVQGATAATIAIDYIPRNATKEFVKKTSEPFRLFMRRPLVSERDKPIDVPTGTGRECRDGGGNKERKTACVRHE